MNYGNSFKLVGLLFFALLIPAAVNGQGCPASGDLNDCLNVRVAHLVKVKMDQNSNTKQTETPSISQNSTSLVDQSSASDLVGVGLNFAGLSTSSLSKATPPNSLSVTTTAYALYSAFKGADPLNPSFYNKHRDWRRFSITLGYDDEKNADGTDVTPKPKLIGVKYLIINRRDPNRKEFEGDLKEITKQLSVATGSFSSIINQTRALIFKNKSVITSITTTQFAEYLNRRLRDVVVARDAAKTVSDAAQSAATETLTDSAAVVARVEAVAVTVLASTKIPGVIENPARRAVTDVVKAVRNAAAVSPTNAANVASAARAALSDLPEPSQVATLQSLQGRPIEEVFVLDGNGFVVGDADDPRAQEIRRFHGEFMGKYTTGAGFSEIRNLLGDDFFEQLDKIIEKDLSSFTALRQISLNTIDKIRRAPQLSVAYFTKQRREGIDEHSAEMIFDWGVANKLNLTANAVFEYKDSKVIGGDTRGARFSAQFRYQVNRNDLQSLLGNKTPVYFDLSAEGSRMSGQNSTVKGQAKLTIPLGNTGIQFPISVTIANRTELIKEKEARGQFGFTFDFSKLVSALNSK